MRLPRTLFTNVGLTEDGDVCWEGMEPVPEGNLTDWHRNPGWRPGDKEKSNPGENHPVTTALCSGGQSSPRLTPASASFYLTEVRKRLMNRMGLGHGFNSSKWDRRGCGASLSVNTATASFLLL